MTMNDYLNQVVQAFNNIAPGTDFRTLRLTNESREAISAVLLRQYDITAWQSGVISHGGEHVCMLSALVY